MSFAKIFLFLVVIQVNSFKIKLTLHFKEKGKIVIKGTVQTLHLPLAKHVLQAPLGEELLNTSFSQLQFHLHNEKGGQQLGLQRERRPYFEKGGRERMV